jgi:hypothetical protein
LRKKDERIREIAEPFYYRLFLIPQAKMRQKECIQAIRKKGRSSLVFVVSSLPMWRSQTLYDLLSKDDRFDIHFALFPLPTFSPAQRATAIQQFRSYFDKLQIPYLDLSGIDKPGHTLRKRLDPDILFYPQPYSRLFSNDLDSFSFSDKLLCYIPYAMLTASEPWAYRNHLNNIAWRLFFQSESRKEEAARVLYSRGKNIRVVGDPVADLFSLPMHRDVWKPQEKKKKRVIWAPHFTLSDDFYLHRNAFSWLSDFMLDVAARYHEQIQFAFKPHPRLLSVLYDRPDWGKERADDYYARWAEGANTQLETGNYIDLFKGSDAMIHDSSSFSVEYHFTGKPVLFTATDLEPITRILNEFGQAAIRAHYPGKTTGDIFSFLDNVVLGEQDPMAGQRQAFYHQYLLPPGGRSVAENIYQDLVTSIWG